MQRSWSIRFFDAELRVNTDASSRANAGAIHWVIRGRLQPFGFFSHWTSAAKARYLAYDLEPLPIYSTILKFRYMLEEDVSAYILTKSL